MKKFYQLVVAIFVSCFSFAQVIKTAPDGGGKIRMEPGEVITPEQRTAIIGMLKRNTSALERQGILPTNKNNQNRTAVTGFAWPLRQAAGFNDPSYLGISNYVDEDPTYPNHVLDYNCGNRTYDQPNGYNHQGTDIFIWPWPWLKMSQNAVEIIAAAPGVIIGKSDGNYDKNCAFCSSACDWNAVYVQHADGSVAWYGHMKSGSQTTKAVGQSVALGEFLGVVGSSGNSTGPHLHFEVYTNNTYTQLVDPWAGTCNYKNGSTSWWASQQPYRVSTLNKVMTGSAAPLTGSCPGSETTNEKKNFSPGDVVYLSSYYRDQLNGQSAMHKVYMPNGTLWSSWTQTFTTDYNASYWYYSFTLPNLGNINGTWRYEITYMGQILSTNFGINTTLPLTLLSFSGTKQNKALRLKWETENEVNLLGFDVERSQDGQNFESIASVAAKDNPAKSTYDFTDTRPLKGIDYYRLKIKDRNGSFHYSAVCRIDNKDGRLWVETGLNPFSSQLFVTVKGESNKISYRLFTITGQLLLEKDNVKAGPFVIPADNCRSGIYVLCIYDEGIPVE